MVPSSPADARYRPSGEKLKPTTDLVCPSSVRTSFPEDISQRRIRLSAPPVAAKVPSGEKATAASGMATSIFSVPEGPRTDASILALRFDHAEAFDHPELLFRHDDAVGPVVPDLKNAMWHKSLFYVNPVC